MNEKIEKFMQEVGMKETTNPKLNLYINEKGRLDESLMYWKQVLLERNWEVVNLFNDENEEDLMCKKGYNEALAHYINGDDAELLVKSLKTLSEDELEARTIRYMFSQYVDTTIEVVEERIDKCLEEHIAEICRSDSSHTYDIGLFDKQEVNRVLMYKAKFEMMWHKQCFELESRR